MISMGFGKSKARQSVDLPLGDEEGDVYEEEFIVKKDKTSPEDDKFDEIIGALEDVLVDDAFTDLQHSFFDTHCETFTRDEENKLVYTEIFADYTQKLEQFITKSLKSTLPWFSMSEFLTMLKARKNMDIMDGELFEVLASLGDFHVFKELILDYKDEKGGLNVDLSGLLQVTHKK